MSAWTWLLLLIAIELGYSAGWHNAHSNIARECRLLGGFYVGSSVFRCTQEKHD